MILFLYIFGYIFVKYIKESVTLTSKRIIISEVKGLKGAVEELKINLDTIESINLNKSLRIDYSDEYRNVSSKTISSVIGGAPQSIFLDILAAQKEDRIPEFIKFNAEKSAGSLKWYEIFILILIVFGLVVGIASKDTDTKDMSNPDVEDKKKITEISIQAQFEREFIVNGSTVKVDATNIFGFGNIAIKNNTTMAWEGVRVSLNPITRPVERDSDTGDFIERVKVFKDLIMSDAGVMDGFVAPHGASIIGPVPRGKKIRINWDDFIDSDTNEKFSPSRYALETIMIKFKVKYQGQMKTANEVFKYMGKYGWREIREVIDNKICLTNRTPNDLRYAYRREESKTWNEISLESGYRWQIWHPEKTKFQVKFDGSRLDGNQEVIYTLDTGQDYRGSCEYARSYKFLWKNDKLLILNSD